MVYVCIYIYLIIYYYIYIRTYTRKEHCARSFARMGVIA